MVSGRKKRALTDALTIAETDNQASVQANDKDCRWDASRRPGLQDPSEGSSSSWVRPPNPFAQGRTESDIMVTILLPPPLPRRVLRNLNLGDNYMSVLFRVHLSIGVSSSKIVAKFK